MTNHKSQTSNHKSQMDDMEESDMNYEDIKVEEEEEIRIEIVEKEKDTDHMCDLCSVVLTSAKSLHNHKKVKHDNREFLCPDCGISVVGAKTLVFHRRSHRTFQCPSCEKEVNLHNKIRHMKICVQPEISCDQCNFKTKNEYLLERHKKGHKREICNECGYQAKSKFKLDHHKEKKHGPASPAHRQCQTMHSCGYCGYRSRRMADVRRHELSCRSSIHIWML